MKGIGVGMSKIKSKNSVLSFDDVLNDINDWLAVENGENDEVGDNLDEMCSEEEEIDSNLSEECLEEVNREVNLHMTDRLFSNDSLFVFGAIMSKNRFKFLKDHICFHTSRESCGKQIDLQLLERSGKSSIQIFQSMLHDLNIFQLMRHYTQ